MKVSKKKYYLVMKTKLLVCKDCFKTGKNVFEEQLNYGETDALGERKLTHFVLYL